MYGEYRHFNAGSGVVDSCYYNELFIVFSAWPALTLDNLGGDFYVPGSNLGKNESGRWSEILDPGLNLRLWWCLSCMELCSLGVW